MWKCNSFLDPRGQHQKKLLHRSEKKLSRGGIGGVEEFVNAGFVSAIRGRPAEKKGRHVMDDMRVLDRIQYACE